MDRMKASLSNLIEAIEAAGLAYRGAFHPLAEDAVPEVRPGDATGTVVLVGMVGSAQWPAFASSPEAHDGAADPLDRWGHRRLAELAAAFAARALEPSAGPPWWPFQRWAQRAESLYASPLGLLIHPTYGLWHSYRGALLLPQTLPLPARTLAASPCATCAAQPCLQACPVSAFAPGVFHAERCDEYLRRHPHSTCRQHGCAARLACPIGRDHAQTPAQAQFHLEAFLRSRDEGKRG